MWPDFLKRYGNGSPIVPDHMVLLYGNVADTFFDDIQYGEETLEEYLVRHASGRFDHFYYADPVTPLREISHDGNRSNEGGKACPPVAPDRFEAMARNVNQRTGNTVENCSMAETLTRVTTLLESHDTRNMVQIGFIEEYCTDRMNLVMIKKWLQNQKILHSRNLVLLVCHQWSQLCADLKNSNIQKIEVTLPDSEGYEAYLRYLVNYIRGV